jgi:hypothetical protein
LIIAKIAYDFLFITDADWHLEFIKNFIKKDQCLIEVNHFELFSAFHWVVVLERHQSVANLTDVVPVSRFQLETLLPSLQDSLKRVIASHPFGVV